MNQYGLVRYRNLLGHDDITLPAKSMEYSENAVETLAFDILIYREWLGINHK